jgi:hypothetical protein
MRNSQKIVVGKPEGKEPFERPTHGWKDNTLNESYRNRVLGSGLRSTGSGLVPMAGLL